MQSRKLHKLKPKKINNPFVKERKKQKFRKKCILCTIFLIILLILLIYLIFISNIFLIKNININELKKTNKEEIENIVKNQINTSRFFIFSEKKLIFFNKNKLINSLNSYNFAEINIKKKLFSTLNIEIKERELAYTYKENNTFYYLDKNANVINSYEICQKQDDSEQSDLLLVVDTEKLENNQNNQDNYDCIEDQDLFLENKYFPYIENLSNPRIDFTGKYVKINKEYLEFTSRLYNDLGIETDFRVKNFILDESKDTVKVKLYNNLLIFFSLKDDYGLQLQNFYLLRNEYGDKLRDSEYIDIRYGDRIYYH